MRTYTVLALGLIAFTLAGCAAAPDAKAPVATDGGDSYNIIGREDAPVSIIEFSDLQCPYCARFALQTFPEVRRKYIDTGKVRYAARDLPLPFHAFALPAAVAARCAGEQGRFWQYREGLFAEQGQLATAPYDALATRLKLDVPRFTACRKDGRAEAAVRADIEMARANGIGSTPTFVVGRVVDGKFQGETFSGAESFANFAARIDALLAAGK